MSVDEDIASDILIGATTVTEDQAALRFATKYDGQLAYCHTQGAWFEYTGSIWAKCEVPTAFAYARTMARQLSTQVKTPSALQRLKYISAIETLAARDERIAKSSGIWNKDIWLLGTPAGTVDLKTGHLKPPQSSDHITRSTVISPASWAECPQWRAFMQEATAADEDLQRFLQQIAGYALTGSAREQSLFFIYGPGGNGKGIFVNTISAIMGSYSVPAAMNTFTASKYERHSTELAMLAGARLVTASETNQGQRWDQQKIGALTGEDVITARFMRQNDFQFRPEFTLIIVGNHKPALSSVDDAMRRRFNIIPFEHKPANPDRELFNKLRSEWPGILKWMIEGCLDWQADGMQRARSVVEKTDQYFYDEDTLAHWLEDECDVDMGNRTMNEQSGDLFKSWANFCRRNEEYVGNSKTFKAMMEKAGFPFTHTKDGTKGFFLRLRRQSYVDDD